MKPILINNLDLIYIIYKPTLVKHYFQNPFHFHLVFDYAYRTNNEGRFSFDQMRENIFLFLFSKSLIMFITVILAIHIQFLIGLPINDDDNNYNEKNKRADETFLPNENFSLVTTEKLLKLKAFADGVHDPKLHDLYRAVNHYVQMAKKNNEYVLWKYDANQEGLVLILKQNLNGILYYG